MGFEQYYKTLFREHINQFFSQIPLEGSKHYNKTEFTIQYFFLTPQYKYLDFIPKERQGLFAVALYWTVLIDQTFFSYYPRQSYLNFQQKTLYPKFIGNCTAPSLMSSECGHHLHPRKVLLAINDTTDKGNRLDLKIEIFKKDERIHKRENIYYFLILKQSKQVIKDEIKEYFNTHYPAISWNDFWLKCELEL
jgi:hypothetical protein